MGKRYQTIVAELAQRVTELASACQPEIETFLEQCQRGSKEPLSSEEIQYLLARQEQNPQQFPDRVEEPLAYLVFEGDLTDLLEQLVQVPEKHRRLQQIISWLEELSQSDDQDVRDLIGISFGEWLLSYGQDYLPQFWPLMGEGLRESCRASAPDFLTSEQHQRLLNQT